ncbi:MAG: hypothetical protein A2474_05815 [Elusimicrobia bacterium RIFOXYC2_FULL_34_12]|nr:MAG: hypothetical protein A2474_05815 [Elusimicrobia bacterium RIFOXYC2_FULL_34_12]
MKKENFDFMVKYYGNARIKKLIAVQAKNYPYCFGTGKTLVERGWTFPIKEVEISRIDELQNDYLDLFFPTRTQDDSDFYILWDIEYFNRENPCYIFNRENQKKIFEWMEPTLDLVEDTLKSYGIKYIIDITMSGIHIWSKISTDSEAYEEFAKEGFMMPSLKQKYAKVVPNDVKRIKAVPISLGNAYSTAGKLLEYITHSIMKENKKANPFKIPVTISDTPQYGEHYPYSGISSDLTQYAHPIYMRGIRAFCSLHQKTLLNGFEDMGPAIDIVKLNGMSYKNALDIMWDVNKAISFYEKNFAKKSIKVPESNAGWLKALKSYIKSNLRKTHKQWEKASASKPANLDFSNPNIKDIFDQTKANPALLIPGNLQTVAEHFGDTGNLTAAKKVFSIIAKDYYLNNSFGWYDPIHYTGINWKKYDAETATDFWGRIYWSLKTSKLGRGKDWQKRYRSF